MSKANPGMVLGYRTTRVDADCNSLETLYAITSNGAVYRADEREVSSRFDNGDTWSRIDADDAPATWEFIGNYIRPSGIRPA